MTSSMRYSMRFRHSLIRTDQLFGSSIEANSIMLRLDESSIYQVQQYKPISIEPNHTCVLSSSHHNQLSQFVFHVVAYRFAIWNILFQEKTKEYLKMRCQCVIKEGWFVNESESNESLCAARVIRNCRSFYHSLLWGWNWLKYLR